MRKLGHGHTLVFLATEEVIGLIQNAVDRPGESPTAFDVMVWTIRETWRQLQANVPAWAMQGMSFLRRDTGWRHISTTNTTDREVKNLFCEREAKSLLDLYDCTGGSEATWFSEDLKEEKIAKDIVKRCKDFGSISTRGGAIHEEMEIELIHEEEVERDVERPPTADPETHSVHEHVKSFVLSGVLSHGSSAFLSVRRALAVTSLDIPAGTDTVFETILVTEDFYRTIKLQSRPRPGDMDQFLRPVEWLVTSRVDQAPLIVAFSPYEVNQLLPHFRTSQHVRLHVFSAHSNLSVHSLEDLNFFMLPYGPPVFTLPRSMALQVGLFSGSLYLRDKETYQEVCAVLRLCFDPLPDHLAKPEIITSSYFVKSENARRELKMLGPGFEANPLPFLRELLKMRRHGRSLGPSHMGKLLNGIKIFEDKD
jgi:hypothetical protein